VWIVHAKEVGRELPMMPRPLETVRPAAEPAGNHTYAHMDTGTEYRRKRR